MRQRLMRGRRSGGRKGRNEYESDDDIGVGWIPFCMEWKSMRVSWKEAVDRKCLTQ